MCFYGALLAFSHVLTALWWLRSGSVPRMANESEAICWPMFPNCEPFRIFDTNQLHWLVYSYISIALLLTTIFTARKSISAGYFGLIALNLIKVLFLCLDYRLRMNQHYMAGIITLLFLFAPNKSSQIRYIIPLFYFWAGFLKLNSEWLSGSAIYGDIWIFHDSPLLPWACAYVVALEIIGVWGLLSKNRLWFWCTVLQLSVFHIISYSVVSFFYPLLMLSLLSIFPMYWKEDEGSPLKRLWTGRAGILTYALVAFFSTLQIYHFCMPGDTAITGEGRSFALHMFDAKIDCTAQALIKNSSGKRALDLRTHMPIRLECDPVVYWNKARHLCRKLEDEPGFVDIDLSLSSKHSNETSFRQVVDIKNFCSEKIDYSLFQHNEWISY